MGRGFEVERSWRCLASVHLVVRGKVAWDEVGEASSGKPAGMEQGSDFNLCFVKKALMNFENMLSDGNQSRKTTCGMILFMWNVGHIQANPDKE
jgi:hypothetical protein